MTPSARIVVWKAPGDLIWLKNAFYPSPDAVDQRNEALMMVRVWSVRGKLPHSIESTAMLTEVMIHDRLGASQLNLQLSYSTAICRFVNGLLDPAQQSHYAISMHTLARNLNLPASFVEIRHAATHESLPSLAVLRTAASRALEWLWSNYWMWVGVSPEDDEMTAEEPQDVHLSKARLLLKQWRKLRMENPTREIKHGENIPESREALAIMRECTSICGTVEGLDALVDAFLEEKALIPSGKRKSSSLMKGAFALWLPLLESLDAAVPAFAEQLIGSILDILKSTPTDSALNQWKSTSTMSLLASSAIFGPTPEDKEFNKALLAWVKFLTEGTMMMKFGKGIWNESNAASLDIENLVKQCIFSPNEWMLDLLRHLLKMYPTLRPKYSTLASLAKAQAPDAVLTATSSKPQESRKRSIQDVEDELSNFEKRYAEVEKKMEQWMQARRGKMAYEAVENDIPAEPTVNETQVQSMGKWMKYEGIWTPRPIGVL